MTDTFSPAGTKPEASRAATVKTERRRRRDDGPNAGLKLYVPEEAKDPNFEYRWFNDEPGRVLAKTKQDDWDLVKPDELKGLADAERVIERGASGAGGQPRKAFLARKPKEYYQADKAKEQALIDAREESLKRGVAPSPEGLQGPTTYVPAGVNTISHGR